MVFIVMVGEGPPSTSHGPGFNKDVDADLRRHDVGRPPQVNTQGRWYHTTRDEIDRCRPGVPPAWDRRVSGHASKGNYSGACRDRRGTMNGPTRDTAPVSTQIA
jgi:hypothetical protein